MSHGVTGVKSTARYGRSGGFAGAAGGNPCAATTHSPLHATAATLAGNAIQRWSARNSAAWRATTGAAIAAGRPAIKISALSV